MQQSSTEWSFSTRSCSNPTPLGLGAQCSSDSQTGTGLIDFAVKDRQLCPSPWDMSRKQEEENCECGCSKIGPEGGFVYSPAPWRCQEKPENKLQWDFECADCESLVIEVVHLDDEVQEELFFVNHESSDDLKINGLGRFAHHQERNASIVFNRNPALVSCGFAIRISFVQKVENSNLQTPPRISMPRQFSENEEEGPDFALWGILVCVGFLLILVTACVFNFRSDSEEVTAAVVADKHALEPEFQLYSELDRNFHQSPQKIKPNAAAFEIAQQQLRLMKSEGKHEGTFFN